MVPFRSSFIYDMEGYLDPAHANHATDHSVISRESGADTGFVMTGCQKQGNANWFSPSILAFLAYSDANDTGRCIYSDIYTSTYSSGTATGYVSNYTQAFSSNTVLKAGNGGSLLTLANTANVNAAFFNGVTQTAESLLAYMNRLYGEHLGYWYNHTLANAPIYFSGLAYNLITDSTLDIDSAPQDGTIPYTSIWNPPDTLNINGGFFNVPAEYAGNLDLLRAYIVFSPDGPALPQKFKYDVYVKGNDGPYIDIVWNADPSNFDGLNRVVPHVWYYDKSLLHPYSQYLSTDSRGVVVPYINEPIAAFDAVDIQNEWASEHYPGLYTSIATSAMIHNTDALSKIVNYGPNMMPEELILYLRFDFQQINDGTHQLEMVNTDLYRVIVPKEWSSLSDFTVEKISGSAYNAMGSIEVELHSGESEYDTDDDSDDYGDGTDWDDGDDGRYRKGVPKPNIPDIEADDGLGFTDAVLTKSYAVNASTLLYIGAKLWSQDYFDVMRIQDNPIENIVSVKQFPFTSSGTQESIQVGDIDFQINGDVVPPAEKFAVGSVKYEGVYGNFLDGSPYTIVKLILPYVGVVQLDASAILNTTVYVDYVVDRISGDCMAIIRLDKIPYMTVPGHMGIDIPLTSSNRIQAEIAAASNVIKTGATVTGELLAADVLGAGASAATGALSIAGSDYTSQRTAVGGAVCESFANHQVAMTIERPVYQMSEGFKKLKGRPCHKFMTLGSFDGFVQVDSRTQIDIAMTKDENAELERLLTAGVYV